MRKRILVIGIAVLLVVVATVSAMTAFGLFSDTDSGGASGSAGTIDVELHETFNDTKVSGATLNNNSRVVNTIANGNVMLKIYKYNESGYETGNDTKNILTGATFSIYKGDITDLSTIIDGSGMFIKSGAFLSDMWYTAVSDSTKTNASDIGIHRFDFEPSATGPLTFTVVESKSPNTYALSTAVLKVVVKTDGTITVTGRGGADGSDYIISGGKVRYKNVKSISGGYGVNTDKKTFWAEAKGNKRCYVRAKLITSFEWYNEVTAKWEPASIPQEAISYTVNAPLWIEQDGYWYYSKILYPGDLTTKFQVLDVKLTSSVPTFYRDKKLVYRMDVELESSQITHELYKKVFNITDLPPGVEKLPAGY